MIAGNANYMVGGESAWIQTDTHISMGKVITVASCRECPHWPKSRHMDRDECLSRPDCPLHISTLIYTREKVEEGESKRCARPGCENRIYRDNLKCRNQYDLQKYCSRACSRQPSKDRARKLDQQIKKALAENSDKNVVAKLFGVSLSRVYVALNR